MKTDLFIPVLVLAALFASAKVSYAQVPSSSPAPSPSLEQRVADLEAYVNNSGRGADAANAQVSSNIPGPGPGHNAWMMTCAALVLFMTLPGLALFYGGLVRAKNVLSVLAQCLGIAGLVTILWWAAGYSLVFSPGSPFLGGLKFAFFHGVDSQPNARLFLLGLAERVRHVPADVRHHHAGPDHRRDRRAHEIRRRAGLRRASGCSPFISRSPTWSGASTDG